FLWGDRCARKRAAPKCSVVKGAPGEPFVHLGSFATFEAKNHALPRCAVLRILTIQTTKEAVMDDSQENEARTPQNRRYVTELELLDTLDRSLWEVERQRVEEKAASLEG